MGQGSGNLFDPERQSFTQIDAGAAEFAVAPSAGAAAWIDTDVSAVTGVATDRIWLITARADTTGNVYVGARPNGSALVPYSKVIGGCSLLSRVGVTGHLDLFQAPVGGPTIYYVLIGYFS